MANDNKKRLLTLMKYLYTMTDENHKVGTYELLEYLEEQGTGSNRKTLKADIDLLVAEGFDIVTVNSSQNMYYWGERIFDDKELKLLIDAVALSGFVSSEESDRISEKLVSLTSSYQGKRLHRHIFTLDKVKKDSDELLLIIDAINEAISTGKKISFQRFDYSGLKKKRLKNFGEVYVMSPYLLYWNEEHYYLVGYLEKKHDIQAFRVDRMVNVKVSEETAFEKPADFDAVAYCTAMFNPEEKEQVRIELECENEAMKFIIDRFGEDVETDINSFETFLAYVDTALDREFLSWLFRFNDLVRIVNPRTAVEAYEKMVKAAVERL